LWAKYSEIKIRKENWLMERGLQRARHTTPLPQSHVTSTTDENIESFLKFEWIVTRIFTLMYVCAALPCLAGGILRRSTT
jgi:hypothetical protein